MVKSPDAFRTIREVSEWLDTPAHVLRFWESRFTQVKPVKRAGGRRYYRPSDMELLGGIKQLLHEDGLTIRGVQKLLREQGVRHVAAKSPALGLTSASASADGESASGMARRAGHLSARPGDRDTGDAMPSRDGDAPRSLGEIDETRERPDVGTGVGRPPASDDTDPSQTSDAGIERHDAPVAATDNPPQPAGPPHETGGAANTTSSDTAPPPGPENAGAEPLPRQDPILSTLWERRLAGSLREIGPVLARARALLGSMDARD